MTDIQARAAWHRERGAALIVSLIMLLAMTILGVTAARTTALQERMAGNLRQHSIAFEASEATLRRGEAWIEAQIGGPRPQAIDPAACGAPPCDVLVRNELDPMADSTWSGNDVQTNPDITQVANDPQYFIEQQQVGARLAQRGPVDRRERAHLLPRDGALARREHVRGLDPALDLRRALLTRREWRT
ncbi:MAG: PilX N-terminal domain-containing pilus assembly protein [Halofilum sp. (in: g-proteobacteria)]|nr:PilX N-terminal domain-containing pilus assembly protein [Halofilum sp. (in: g-proteobacteria)]